MSPMRMRDGGDDGFKSKGLINRGRESNLCSLI